MNSSRSIFRSWLPLALLATAVFATLYIVAQQQLRAAADDPQVQVVEDVSEFLSQGGPAEAVVPPGAIDIDKSLSLYLVVYNESAQPVVGSGQLAGQPPVPLQDAFDAARAQGQHRFTWEPQAGLRNAAVMNYFSGNATSSFVLAARSLREVEDRQKNIMIVTLVGWLGALVLSLIAVLIVSPRSRVGE